MLLWVLRACYGILMIGIALIIFGNSAKGSPWLGAAARHP